MSERLIRVETPAQVEAIALANRVSFTRTNYAASVTLDGVCYFYSAA